MQHSKAYNERLYRLKLNTNSDNSSNGDIHNTTGEFLCVKDI